MIDDAIGVTSSRSSMLAFELVRSDPVGGVRLGVRHLRRRHALTSICIAWATAAVLAPCPALAAELVGQPSVQPGQAVTLRASGLPPGNLVSISLQEASQAGENVATSPAGLAPVTVEASGEATITLTWPSQYLLCRGTAGYPPPSSCISPWQLEQTATVSACYEGSEGSGGGCVQTTILVVPPHGVGGTIPTGYHDCHEGPGGAHGLFVKHMSCRSAAGILAPPLGPKAPRPRTARQYGFRCRRVDYVLPDEGGIYLYRGERCTRHHGLVGFELLRGDDTRRYA